MFFIGILLVPITATPMPIVIIGVGARHEYYGVKIDGVLQ